MVGLVHRVREPDHNPQDAGAAGLTMTLGVRVDGSRSSGRVRPVLDVLIIARPVIYMTRSTEAKKIRYLRSGMDVLPERFCGL